MAVKRLVMFWPLSDCNTSCYDVLVTVISPVVVAVGLKAGKSVLCASSVVVTITKTKIWFIMINENLIVLKFSSLATSSQVDNFRCKQWWRFRPKDYNSVAVMVAGGWWSVFDMMTSSNGNIFRVTVRGTHWSPVNSLHKGQWRGALMFSLTYTWTNGWVNNRDAGDLRRHRAHYGVTVMETEGFTHCVYVFS